ncbi:MAG TPA: glycosyltransferase [bacterium]|nr:glycosyltransferase [bacterium]HPQ18094.1 glycosyltransferase [bacterium]
MKNYNILFLDKNEINTQHIVNTFNYFPINNFFVIPDFLQKDSSGNYLHSLELNKFLDFLKSIKIDFFFTFISFVNDNYISFLELLYDYQIPIVIWQLDEPYMLNSDNFKKNTIKAISLSSLYCINSLEIENFYIINNIPYLFLPVCGIDYFYNDFIVEENFKYDFSFLGSSNNYREEFFKKLQNILGEKYRSRYDISGTIDYFKKLLTETKINLSIGNAHPSEFHTNWSPTDRLFRAPLAGSFILHDFRKHILDLFKEGEEVVIYYDFDDCVDKIKYYAENKEARIKIVKKAREKILKEHLIRHRFLAIMNKLIELNVIPEL